MDQRLLRTYGTRPLPLTQHELPSVAEGMVAAIRNQARVELIQVQSVPCVRLVGLNVDVTIRGDDWAKMVPYLRDGFFEPSHNPMLRPKTSEHALAWWDDQALYVRILQILQSLFPIKFPTSNL